MFLREIPTSALRATADLTPLESPPSVLLIDDTGASSGVAQALRAGGFAVTEAATGAEALALTGTAAIDVVVLNVLTADPDGFDVCRQLKIGAAGRLPVMHLSRSEILRTPRKYGAEHPTDAFLMHPFDPEELLTAVSLLARVKRTEVARAAQVLANTLLHEALDTLADHVALLAANGDVVGVNQGWAEFAAANDYRGGGTGLGTNYCDVCERSIGPAAAQAKATAIGIREVLAGTRDRFTLDYPCHAPDTERWFRMSVRRVAQPGSVTAIVTHSDRTDEELALRAARAHESRFQGFVQSSRESIWAVDSDGLTTYANPQVSSLLGYSPEDISRSCIFDLMTPASADAARRAFAGSANAQSLEVEFLRKDGKSVATLATISPVLEDDAALRGVLVMITDITKRKGVEVTKERALQSADRDRRRLEATLQALPVGVWIAGADGRVTHTNPAAVAIWGGDAAYVHGARRHAMYRAWWPATGAPLMSEEWVLPRTLRTGATISGEMVEIERFDGTRGHVLNSAAPIHDAAGAIIGAVVVTVDISDHQAAADALRHSEQRLRDLFAKLPVPTFLWEARDGDFVLINFNEAAESTVEPHWRNAVGRTATELFPSGWPIRDDAIGCLRDSVVVRRNVMYEPGAGMPLRTFDLTIGPQHPDRVLVHSVETTERTRLATELRQAQKMEAVGQLAGGVAHDFNNLLTVIGAHSAFLLEELSEADPRRVDASAIQQASDRAGALTRQLLAFSRKQVLSPTVVDLNRVVEEMHRMLGRLVSAEIRTILTLVPDVGHVLVDVGQLEQVIMNLVINARDAMPSGGLLSVTTRSQNVGEHAPALRGIVPPGHYAVLSVADSGVGMNAETQLHIFEPFFSTKEFGKGTGLGLSTVYGIVEQTGGYITVESSPGKGSTFEVYLRVVAAAPASTPRSSSEVRVER